MVWSVQLNAQTADSQNTGTTWDYGVLVSMGYFNFRNSLFVDTGPDPPGNLSDDWGELFIKPWVSFERSGDAGTWFGVASWAYARTGDDASEISGGHAGSTDFDNLYLGWRFGSPQSSQFEVVGGRIPYIIAHGFQSE